MVVGQTKMAFKYSNNKIKLKIKVNIWMYNFLNLGGLYNEKTIVKLRI